MFVRLDRLYTYVAYLYVSILIPQIAHIGDVCQLAVIHVLRRAYVTMYKTFPPTPICISLQNSISKDIINE